MITTITLNPAIDKTIHLDTLHVGSLNRTPYAREDLGGKGINVARLLSGYGIPTNAMFLAGKENWEYFEMLCNKESFELIPFFVNGRTRTNIKIVEFMTKCTTDINESGFTVDENAFSQLMEEAINLARISEYVVIDGSLPKGLPADTYRKMIQELKPITKVVLDADGEALLSGMQAGPYLIKPNIHELEGCLHTTFQNSEEIAQAARNLIKLYGISIIVVSLGEEGSMLVTDKDTYRAGIVPVEVKSTVGAGDAMLAGVLYGLTRKMPYKKALALGTASSALAIEQFGHQRSESDSLDRTAKSIEIEMI